MTDSEKEIIRLLTEIRDGLREESAQRRKVIDESVALQKKSVRMQRGALIVLPVCVIFGIFLIVKGILKP